MILKLVKYFENKYNHIEVRSVWLIEKSRENDGFQGWHRDFFLGTEVTMTIVVNVGAIMKNWIGPLPSWSIPCGPQNPPPCNSPVWMAGEHCCSCS
jgi:hypothetical protein